MALPPGAGTGAPIEPAPPPGNRTGSESEEEVKRAAAMSRARETALTRPGVNPRALPVKSTPHVITFNELEHTCKEGETYASISKEKYLTEKYSEALRLYNLYDALVDANRSPRGGQLRKGDLLIIPDLSALEARYARHIPGYQPLPEKAFNANKTSSNQTASYTVRGKGEMMREIARNQLGNGNRWQEISKLNPGYDPAYEIPGGTRILLPTK